MNIQDSYILGHTQRARFTNATVRNMRTTGTIKATECEMLRTYLDTLSDCDLSTAMVDSHNVRIDGES